MKYIFKQLLVIILLCLGWYILALGLSYALYPDHKDGIDTEGPDNNVFQSSIVLGVPRIASSLNKKIFLIGSSNVREGFRPKELQLLLPEYEVHNLGRGASNVTQVRDTVNLLQLLPEEALEESVFVFGMWYGVFVDDQARWKGNRSTIVTEALHSGLYKLDRETLKTIIEINYLPHIITLLRPVFFLEGVITTISSFALSANEFMCTILRDKRIKLSILNPKKVNYPEIDETYKKRALRFWHDYMRTEGNSLKDEQFDKLLDLCSFINENGGIVILVDLPLPKWHSENSGHYGDYQRRKLPYIKKVLRFAKVRYFNMQDRNENAYFYDSAHLKSGMTKEWSIWLQNCFVKSGLVKEQRDSGRK